MKRTTAIMLAVILVAAIAIGALISQKNTLVSEKDTLAQQVENLTGEVDSLNAKLKADEEEAKKLGDTEAEKEKIAEEKKVLEEKITELEEAAKANEEELKKLKAEAGVKGESLIALQNALEAAKLEKENVAEEKTALEEKITKLEEAAKANEEELKKLKAEAEVKGESLIALQNALEAAKLEKENIAEEKKVLEDKITEFEEAEKPDEKELKKLKAEAEVKGESLIALQNALEAAKLEKENVAEEKTALEEKITELEEAAKANEEELKKLKAEAKVKGESLIALQKGHEAVKLEKEALSTEKQALEDKASGLEETVKAKEEELSAKISALEENVAATEAELESAKESIALLQTEKEELEKAKAALEEELEAAENNLAAMKVELENVDTALSKAKEEKEPESDDVAKVDSITILHTNDIHARVEGNDKNLIGYPLLVAIANEHRKEGEVLLLDAGDTLHGTSFANLTQGESIVEIMNLAGYDAMAPGNHDFNYGYDRLMELEKLMEFKLVNANIYIGEESAFAPVAILEKGGRKIAVVGVANPDMKSAIHPDRIKDLDFRNYNVLTPVVNNLKDETDAVIVLAHWGSDDAYVPNSSVLATIPGVDLVVDGHSHTSFEDIKQVEGAALIVSAGGHMSEIGRVEMRFTDDGVVCKASPISYEEAQKYTPDEDIAQLIANLKAKQEELLNTVIGKTEVFLDGERETNRTGETNLGNLATNALLWYSGADFAFTNGGGIRTSIDKGDITQGNIIEVFPFGNSVVIIEATGENILKAMEHGLSKYPETNGGFPQIGGGKLVFDPAKEAGSRVVEMEINGEAIEPDKKYTLVTNDFLAAGGDGYEMLKDCPLLRYQGTLDEAFIEYIRHIGVVNIDIEGRITHAEAEPYKVPETKVGP